MFGLLRFLVLMCSAVGIGIALRLLRVEPPTRLSFLAVGQGDCIVFQTAGVTVLIDAGPKTDTFDAGARIVVPELYRLGVDKVDLVLLSHPDADHVGGLPAIAKRFRIGKVCVSASFERNGAMLDWLRRARLDNGQIAWLGKGSSTNIGGFTLRLDCPPIGPDSPDNEGSMFVRLEGQKASAVFSGDAGIETEERMLATSEDWHAQILKAGHHGSRGSMGWRWIRVVRPSVVVFSAGRNNTYGHPSSLAIQRLKNANVPYLRTDRQGTLTFEVGAQGFQLSSR